MKNSTLIFNALMAMHMLACNTAKNTTANAKGSSTTTLKSQTALAAPNGYATVVASFCLDSDVPLVTWQSMPSYSELVVYSRWGEQLFVLSDPNAIPKTTFSAPPKGLTDVSQIYFVLTFIASDGNTYTQNGYFTYLGAHCK
ncbi:MAG: hypothetical protein ACKVOR_06265 [Flavobacteriales bacterium]